MRPHCTRCTARCSRKPAGASGRCADWVPFAGLRLCPNTTCGPKSCVPYISHALYAATAHRQNLATRRFGCTRKPRWNNWAIPATGTFWQRFYTVAIAPPKPKLVAAQNQTARPKHHPENPDRRHGPADPRSKFPAKPAHAGPHCAPTVRTTHFRPAHHPMVWRIAAAASMQMPWHAPQWSPRLPVGVAARLPGGERVYLAAHIGMACGATSGVPAPHSLPPSLAALPMAHAV